MGTEGLTGAVGKKVSAGREKTVQCPCISSHQMLFANSRENLLVESCKIHPWIKTFYLQCFSDSRPDSVHSDFGTL